MAVEGVLLKLGGYTHGENQWALYRAEESADSLLLFSLPEEVPTEGGPLEEGQQVQVTCRSVQEIAPPILEEVSQVKVLGKASQEELETAQAKAAKYVENLIPPEEGSQATLSQPSEDE